MLIYAGGRKEPANETRAVTKKKGWDKILGGHLDFRKHKLNTLLVRKRGRLPHLSNK